MRKLLLIPDVHSTEQFGVDFNFDRIPGFKREAEEESKRLFELVREAASISTVDFTKVRIFAEGEINGGDTIGGRYREIFPEARVEVTESNDAYYGFSDLAQELTDLIAELPEDQEIGGSDLEEIESLLSKIDEADQERDRVIAANINRALKEGETGVLIIGAGHYRMLGMLNGDITVELLDPRLREFIENTEHNSFYELFFEDSSERKFTLEDLDSRFQVRREGAVG